MVFRWVFKVWVACDDIDTVLIWYRYLQSLLKNQARLNSITRLSISSASVIIQEIIDNYFYNNNDLISHYCWKIDEFLDSILPENEFYWFKKTKMLVILSGYSQGPISLKVITHY